MTIPAIIISIIGLFLLITLIYVYWNRPKENPDSVNYYIGQIVKVRYGMFGIYRYYQCKIIYMHNVVGGERNFEKLFRITKQQYLLSKKDN